MRLSVMQLVIIVVIGGMLFIDMPKKVREVKEIIREIRGNV